MTTPYTAATLDLANLPAFNLTNPDYETILQARLADLASKLSANGVAYDVGQLQTDPLAILEQEDAYRELLAYQAMNDAALGLTLAKATGPALDAIAATYYADLGLRRMTGEGDEAFRARIALAPEARTSGSLGGYEFWARSASAAVVDARCYNYASGLVNPGQLLLVVAGAPGVDTGSIVSAVQSVVLDRNIKAASDDLRVIAATPVAYDVTANLIMLPGPDSSLVIADATNRLQTYAAGRRRVGMVVYEKGIEAALMTAAVDNVSGPISDINPGLTGIATIGNINLTAQIINA